MSDACLPPGSIDRGEQLLTAEAFASFFCVLRGHRYMLGRTATGARNNM